VTHVGMVWSDGMLKLPSRNPQTIVPPQPVHKLSAGDTGLPTLQRRHPVFSIELMACYHRVEVAL